MLVINNNTNTKHFISTPILFIVLEIVTKLNKLNKIFFWVYNNIKAFVKIVMMKFMCVCRKRARTTD